MNNIFEQLKNLLSRIWNIIKLPFVWLLNFPPFGWIRRILTFLFRLLIPVLLFGLLVVPIVLTYFPQSKKTNVFNSPKLVAKNDVIKKISVQATVENVFEYDLPVYQDAELKEITVKQGDTIKAGQLLANLEFVTENKARATDAQNQINSNYTEINNNQDALNKALNLNKANLSQQDINLKTKTDEWNNINQKRVDKINSNNQKRYNYDNERADFQRQYDQLESKKSVNNSVKQYEDQIKKLQDGLNASNNTALSQTQIQINTTKSQIEGFKGQLSLTTSQNCSAYSFVAPAPDLTSIKNQCILAEQNLGELNNQFNITNNTQGNSTSATVRDINDLRSKINQLKNDPSYDASKPVITDQYAEAQVETKKGDLKAKINTREAEIRQLDNSEEVRTLEDQLKAIERTVTDIQAQQNASRKGDDSTVAGILQRIRTAQTSLSGSQNKLGDIGEDIAKQEKNKTITAKRDGVVGKVYKEQGLVANARENVFRIVSPDYRLKFKVSADNRGLIKNGIKIKTDKFKDLDSITVTETNLVPNVIPAGAVNAAIEYDIFALLPKTDKYVYTQGETVNVDVIVDQKTRVISVPSTSVSDNKVFVGIGASEIKKKEGKEDELNNNANTADTISAKFTELKVVNVKIGLDDGKTVEILEGLNEGQYVFSIFPKTQAEKDSLIKENVITKK